MASGKVNLKTFWRAARTVFFLLSMVTSLLMLSAPLLVALGDVTTSLVLASRCYGVWEHMEKYTFQSSLMDIPLVSIVRSLIITCVYSLCNGPGLSHGPYLGTVTLCSFASIIILSVKASVFSSMLELEPKDITELMRQKLHVKSRGMPALFISSLIFSLGHAMVAYLTSCKGRRKLHVHQIDPEAILACRNAFSGQVKVPRSPTPCHSRNSKGNNEIRRKGVGLHESELPSSLLADVDSMFVTCQGLTIHYKISVTESPLSRSLSSSSFPESSPNSSPPHISPKPNTDRFQAFPSGFPHNVVRNFSNHLQTSSLDAPLLEDLAASPTFFSDEISTSSSENSSCSVSLYNPTSLEIDDVQGGKVAVVLVHGFGGGVFAWRHVMGVLARLVGCNVVAFDRPGWGLTSRPGEEIGKRRNRVEVKGVVLVSVSLSRAVVPGFARILLHTSLRKKHMFRPLLRTEITQVINRRAWHDATKLTTEVLNVYKAPLYVEGWEEALHEIGRLSFSTVLSPQDASSLLESVKDLPVLVVTGADDALVPLKSAQQIASRLVNSRLVAVPGCGHLPHEECPKALLGALSPFISSLLPRIHGGVH
ncbi:unnamed protein product [Spirodela intermedia]|uniref:AB hydrolase-1 domain-containing protein n=1 Tax=Spirodela intermedia TaxID=51605 RepID=A0A7I8ISQ1_SPIIN|nr:unnamed protein product [Spirodela intermedia]CAA6660810.1 unnamed protein product [Spirodela intermedia]